MSVNVEQGISESCSSHPRKEGHSGGSDASRATRHVWRIANDSAAAWTGGPRAAVLLRSLHLGEPDGSRERASEREAILAEGGNFKEAAASRDPSNEDAEAAASSRKKVFLLFVLTCFWETCVRGCR